MLFEKITAEERDAIETYLSRNNDGYSLIVSLEAFLEEWENEKNKYLYKLLGNKLNISKPIIHAEEPENMTDSIINIIDNSSFIKEFKQFRKNYIEEYKDNPKMKDVISGLYALTSCYNFEENNYLGIPFSIVGPEGKGHLRVNTGAKVTRVFSKLAKMFDIVGYEEFSIAMSQIYNEKNIEGTLHLSIHPLDYLTMSDNNFGWNSCMSFEGNGEYRLGVIEMLNSGCVIEAYITNKEDINTFDLINAAGKNFKWTDKKWRELFIVTPECITGIKGYPYWNRSIEDKAIEWIKELAKDNLGWEFDKRIFFKANKSFTYNKKKYHFTFNTNNMYNDMYSNHAISLNNNIENTEYKINYSGKAICTCCGKANDFTSAQFLVCNQCDDSVFCDCCGDKDSRDNLYWIETEEVYVCEYCYERNYQQCEKCGYSYYYENLIDIYFCDNNKVYLDSRTALCNCCQNLLEDKIKDQIQVIKAKENEKDKWHRRYYDCISIDHFNKASEFFSIDKEELIEKNNTIEYDRKEMREYAGA